MTRPCTRQDGVGWVKRQLGCGMANVELTAAQLDDFWDDAIRWWAGRRGIEKLAAVQLTPGFQEYTMPDDTDFVIDVFFPGVQVDVIAAVNPFAFIDVDQLPVAYQSITGVPGGSFYGTLFQILQHAGTARRVMSSEPAFDYDRNRNIVRISPRNVRDGTAFAQYLSRDVTSESSTDDFCVRLTERDRDLILKYALAKAKYTLGLIRSKYSDWPSAGGRVSMDGDSLRTEAQAEMAELNEELLGLNDPVPFITG